MVRTLMVISLFAQALLAQNMTFLQGDWGKTGINIVPNDSSPAFRLLAESSASPDLSQSGIDVNRILPYSFVLRNNTAHAIVGISARWVTTDANGKVLTNDHVWTNLESPSEGLIAPYSDRLVMPFSPVAPSKSPTGVHDFQKIIEDTQQAFAKQAMISVSLEVAILDDGRALGSDSANVVPQISARLDSEREVLGEIVTASQQGQSVVVEYLKGLASGPRGGAIDASRENTAARAYAAFFSIQRGELARGYLIMAERHLEVLTAYAQTRLKAPRFTIYR